MTNPPTQDPPQNPPASPPANTPTPSNQSTDSLEATKAFYESLLNDANNRAARAEADAQAARGNVAAAPPPPPVEVDVIGNPQGFLTAIRQEIKQQVAPLDDFRLQYQRQQQYELNKNLIKANPQVAPHWHLLEPHLNQAFANGQLKDTSLNGLAWACQTILGNLVFNNPSILQTAAPAATTPPANPPRTPPNVAPSAPPAPVNPNQNGAALRDLTEAEERLRRQWGMTKEEFLKGSEGDAITVSTPKPAASGAK